MPLPKISEPKQISLDGQPARKLVKVVKLPSDQVKAPPKPQS